MASEPDLLATLEAVLHEFFAPETTNNRKREIENDLERFRKQDGSWKHCLYFMANTNNHYVCMYCLTTIENVIHREWLGVMGEVKGELRSTLYRFLYENHTSVPTFIRNKLVKLVVDIARLDWPHFYPDFFSNILQLIQLPDCTVLGLIFLQTTSEELGCPREDLNVARKEELHRLLLEQVPHILSILTGILEVILDKQKHAVTATPPPSPTYGDFSDNVTSLFSTSPVHTGSLLNSMFKNLGKKNPFSRMPPLDEESEYTCALTLKTLAHLFSWIPLSSYITPNLLSIIFHFASLGADPQHNSRDSLDNSQSSNPSIGVLAMSAVNELMYKNCVPADFEEFLLQMFQNTFHLLQTLVQDVDLPSINSRLHQLNESYVEKFTEFLQLFVNVHLRRFEDNSRFPVLEFLALLFKYTFQQPTIAGFFLCLDIWNTFLDYLAARMKGRQSNQNGIIQRYQEALIAVVAQVLKRLQFKYNQSQLEEMDDETLDDDNETEWQHYLRQCIEVIAKVADILPMPTLELVSQLWIESSDAYLSLESAVVTNNNQCHLNITAEHECCKLHCYMRDLSSALQILGRLSAHFIGEPFYSRLTPAEALMDKLVAITAFGSKMKLYKVNVTVSVLTADFIEVHAQAMAALKAWCHWLAQLYGEGLHNPAYQQRVTKFVSDIVRAVMPIICEEEIEKLAHSSTHLLATLTRTVRPPILWEMEELQTLYHRGPTLKHLPNEAHRLLQRALVNVLLLPWPGSQEQLWEKRQMHLNNYLQNFTSDFRKIKEMPNFTQDKNLQEQVTPLIIKTLQILSDQVENITDESTHTKKVCYLCLQDLIQQALWLFPIYVLQPDVCEEILSFFLTVFNVLQVQMGVPFIEQVIQTFLDVFTREQLSYTLLSEGSDGGRVIERFLKILQLIVREPGSDFKRFLSSSLTLCMDHVYPIVGERISPDIKVPLFDLLYTILLYNWRYFFKSSVLSTFGAPGNESVENKPQFEAIMRAFGQSFLQSDIVIFKQNLEALESLNTKWKLYHKTLFREYMLQNFMDVLLNVLVNKTHDLLKEEVSIAIYNMASVDFDMFYGQFLIRYLKNTAGLDNNQREILKVNFKLEMDLPSFTQNMHRFINDLRYYRLCNASLPEGTVKFN